MHEETLYDYCPKCHTVVAKADPEARTIQNKRFHQKCARQHEEYYEHLHAAPKAPEQQVFSFVS